METMLILWKKHHREKHVLHWRRHMEKDACLEPLMASLPHSHFDFSLKATLCHQLQILLINLCAWEYVSKNFVQCSYTLFMKEQIASVFVLIFLCELKQVETFFSIHSLETPLLPILGRVAVLFPYFTWRCCWHHLKNESKLKVYIVHCVCMEA